MPKRGEVGMACSKCRAFTKVVRSIPAIDGSSIKRTRECMTCKHKMSTIEQEYRLQPVKT